MSAVPSHRAAVLPLTASGMTRRVSREVAALAITAAGRVLAGADQRQRKRTFALESAS